jgi:hypothetical protein
MCSMNSQGGVASAGRIGAGRLALGGFAAALISWLVVVLWYPFYFSGLSFAPGVAPTPEQMTMLVRQTWVNTLALFALFGAALSTGLNITAALHRRSKRMALIGIPTGVALGGAFGALGGWCGQALSDSSLLQFIDRSRPEAELTVAVIVHAACWAVIGFGVGLGFALTALNGRDRLYAPLGACLGGMLATPCYQVIIVLVCLISPMGGTDSLIPEGNDSRLIWLITAGLAIGIGTGGLTGGKRKPAAPVDAPQGGNPS